MVCIVLATIKSVEEQHGWFYVACRKHNKKVVRKSEFVKLDYIEPDGEDVDDGSLYCPRCNGKASSVYPRFVINK